MEKSYIEVGNIDMIMIGKFLSKISEEDWYVSTYRDNIPTMLSTNSIPLHHTSLCASGLCNDDAINSIRKEPLFYKFEGELMTIIEILKEHYNFKQYAAFLARLDPESEIGEHVDSGNFLTKCHRIHIPLKTNPDVAYCIDNIEYHWPSGKIYEFDNTRLHSVKNRSKEQRIHLVVNLYP